MERKVVLCLLFLLITANICSCRSSISQMASQREKIQTIIQLMKRMSLI